jgi:mono/diheme cytochrome c family protein
VPQEKFGSGWYTEAQAAKGAAPYAQSCASCHGATLGGGTGPALVGAAFWQKWGGKSLAKIWDQAHAQMPLNAPASQPADVSLDILAYLLSKNGVPAGKTALTDSTDLSRLLPSR